MAKAYNLLLGTPGRMWLYPDPQKSIPCTIEGLSTTDPPLSNFQRTSPVIAFSAYMIPGVNDAAYITPLATLTEPIFVAPWVGLGTCQRILPVATSSAAQEPQVIVGPFGCSV